MVIHLTLTALDRVYNHLLHTENFYGYFFEYAKPKEKPKPMPKEEPVVYVRDLEADKPEAQPNEKVTYKVTKYSQEKVTENDKKRIQWAIKIDGKQEVLKEKGEKLVLTIKEEWAGKEIIVMPFLVKPDEERVSKKTRVSIFNYGRAMMFILTDELLPTGKLVRKVVVPPSKKIFNFIRSNQYEMFGMSATDPLADITIGEHAFGKKPSPYISASTLSKGAPNIMGSPQYIDIAKAEAAGCKIYTTNEIIQDLRRMQKEAPSINAKTNLEKLINVISNTEKEVLIKGNIPPSAIKSSTTMNITKGLRVLNIIGIVISAYEVEQAVEKSIKKESVKPIAAETIRQVGGWASAIAGAKVGAVGGTLLGIETGPGAILFGAGGAIIFGVAGYLGADWIADYIDEN
ncbi:hypothetical protein [Capnocytophaga canimorsus]|uniref:hypothetical protein n=1 Tax=Capnocytophaga canimorsus TaxID=28188 RepID=UPI0021002AE5|nr:hypothetical protein [Capnocytophaga canimorsus]